MGHRNRLFIHLQNRYCNDELKISSNDATVLLEVEEDGRPNSKTARALLYFTGQKLSLMSTKVAALCCIADMCLFAFLKKFTTMVFTPISTLASANMKDRDFSLSFNVKYLKLLDVC